MRSNPASTEPRFDVAGRAQTASRGSCRKTLARDHDIRTLKVGGGELSHNMTV